ncbi:MAG: RNA polymerase [Flammeovirgaceae bacterium]|nr:RNA polymerase [Flammeovirgaceae bacterium]MBE63214.1 RNA polymerase [Flammeovirgaceae bacterium]MBR07392.1 RNA polymerase [Rickettsiales bacterium]
MENSTINIHAELIARCRDRDQIAQYEIYQLYSKAMFNTALRICALQEEAEDVLQESFLSAFRNIDSYREDATFGAWLKRIVVNKAITSLRKSQKEALMIEEVEEYQSLENSSVNISELSVDRVKYAMMDLPKGFRSVLSLYLFEGYDHKEISEILGITESTSKSQYKRAKDKLKQILQKEVNYG